MVSLKSFLHYFSPARPAQPLSEAEKQQIEALIQAFGGEANITQVDACITRLRVSVRHLAAVDSEALQQQGALGVIILGQQVHAIFGKQSDALRQLLDEHFAARQEIKRDNLKTGYPENKTKTAVAIMITGG